MLKGVTYLSSDLNKLVCLTWDNVHSQINIILKRCKLKISPEKKIWIFETFSTFCLSALSISLFISIFTSVKYCISVCLSITFLPVCSSVLLLCLFSICQILPFSLSFHLSNRTFLFDFSFVYICHGKMGLAGVWTFSVPISVIRNLSSTWLWELSLSVFDIKYLRIKRL